MAVEIGAAYQANLPNAYEVASVPPFQFGRSPGSSTHRILTIVRSSRRR
jgi:hypothetical protein